MVHLPTVMSQAFGISTSEARRTLAQGGVRLDGEPVGDGVLDLDAASVDGKLLQVGRRRFVRLRVV
jgi:tyrosyl-tRNA synthetase